MSTISPTSGVSAVAGQYTDSIVLIGSAVSLTTNVEANITSISLSPGEWDVSGSVGFAPAATTSMTHLSAGISTTSATMAGAGTQVATTFPAIIPGTTSEWYSTTPVVQIVITVTTTVYLVAHTLFTVSTLGGYGNLRARRIR